MADEFFEEGFETESVAAMPWQLRAGVLGTSAATAGTIELVGHFGFPGLVFGTLGVAAATCWSPVVWEACERRLSERMLWRLHRMGLRLKLLPQSYVQERWEWEEEEEVYEESTWEEEYPEEYPEEDGGDEDGWEEEPSASRFPPNPVFIGPNPAMRLDLAPNYQPDANAPLATGVLAVGCPGSGKTVVLARFVEQYIQHFEVPCLLIDSQGDFKSLVEDGFCPRGRIGTKEHMPSMLDVVLDGLQVVMDLSTWHESGEIGVNWEMAAIEIEETIRTLLVLHSRTKPDERRPVLVVIDEVHLLVPEKPSGLLTQATARRLLTTMTTLATTGRKLGVVPFFATQRIAIVHKDVIGSFETRLFGRVDLDNDLRRYREYLDERVASTRLIRGLANGEMVVTFGGNARLVQFHHRETRHVSHTPKLAPNHRMVYHRHGVRPQGTAQRRDEREQKLRHSQPLPRHTSDEVRHSEAPSDTQAARLRQSPAFSRHSDLEGLHAELLSGIRAASGRHPGGMSAAERRRERLERQHSRGTATQGEVLQESARTNAAMNPLLPTKQRRATLADAIEVWNALGEIGRPRLREELQAKGLECSDDLAKNLLRQIKRQLVGGGGGGEEEEVR
jgi:hypothetical protein